MAKRSMVLALAGTGVAKMSRRWLMAAVIAAGWCLTTPLAQAQFGLPGGGSSPGPMNSCMAPPGPGDDLGLPADIPNAFSPPCCKERPGYCCNGMWFSAEYLLWFIKDPKLPAPLITTGGTGVLTDPATFVFLGNNDIDYPSFSGGRVSAGFWLDNERLWSIEGSGFLLEKRGDSPGVISDGTVTVSIPFIDANTGAPAAFPVAQAGQPGGVQVAATSLLWGAEANLVYAGVDAGAWSVAWIMGFRYLDLAENLDLNATSIAGGATTVLHDHFGTRNQFYGGQFGARFGCTSGCLFWAAQAVIALGQNHETLVAFGEQANITASTITATGLFAHTANSGHFNQDEFAYVPEGQLKIGYRVSRNITLTLGYTFLYWHEVARAGDQINPVTTAPGTNLANVPQVLFEQRYIWAQGGSLGLEMRY